LSSQLRWDVVKNKILQKIEKFHFLPILATFYEVKITFLKKLVGGAPVTYFKVAV
jgi:hypothetical protein